MEEPTQDEHDENSQGASSQKLKNFKAKQVRAHGKVRQLGVFTTGLGVLLAVLTTIAVLVMPDPGGKPILLGIMVGVAATLLVMGWLTIWTRNKIIILITMVLVSIYLLGDVMLALNPLKLVAYGGVLYVVGKTGSEALAEVSKYG